MKYYTGVGSRETPQSILKVIYRIACNLRELGWILRTGDADGADAAFSEGAGKLKTVFTAKDATPHACRIAQRFHPAWNRCSQYAKKLHGRNSFQVLGRDLKTPSRFVICSTRDGATTHAERSIITGGTGTAISIASHYGIPVFNLARPEHLKRFLKFIDQALPKENRSPLTTDLIQITAPHFCAGLELKKRPSFNKCAPIINYMKTWDWKRIKDYTATKGWSLVKVA